jgi:GNAT superfamily N-acetyltransferase
MRDMISVFSATNDRKPAVLAVLLSNLPVSEREQQICELLEAEREKLLSLDGLLAAVKDNQIVGAALFLMQPDRCAYVWRPVVLDSTDSAPVADALLSDMGKRIQQENAWIGQCLIDPHETLDREALSRNGFPHLADLHYLSRPLADPIPDSEEIRLTPIRYGQGENHERFRQVIERTYIGSLDCPGIQGNRTGEDAIISHQSTGVFLPDQWTIFSDERGDAGLLLLAEHPEQQAWEVVYMGIVPEARGNRYGREILLTGLAAAKSAGCESVVLAVDSNNQFARRLYDGLGFQQTETRSVHAMIPSSGNKDVDRPQIVNNPQTGE